MQILKQSTAVDVLIGPFVDSGDGVTPEASLTLSQADIKLSKNGQTPAQKSDNTAAAAAGSDGYYNCELDATDTNTVGTLVLIVNESGALPVRHEFQVVEEAVYDALFAASAAGYATPSALATVDSNVDAILVDTDTTIPGLITTVDSVLDGLVADVGSNGAGLTALPWNSAWDAEVQSEVTDALNAYDPPTKAELDSAVSPLATSSALGTVDTVVDGIKAVTDNLPDSGALTTIDGKLDTIDGNVDAVLEDTGTTLPGTLATIAGYLDTEIAAILTDTGTTLDGKLDAIDSVVDAIKAVTDELPDSGALTTLLSNVSAILADTGTTLDGKLDAIDSVVDAIKAVTDNLPDSGALSSLATASALSTVDTVVDRIETDTQDIQSRLPAALVSGRMSSDAVAISGSTDAADNLEASTLAIIRGAAETGTLSTTQMTTDLEGYDDDRLIGRVIVFTSAPLAGEATEITDYASSGGVLTFTQITEAPTNGATFVIV